MKIIIHLGIELTTSSIPRCSERTITMLATVASSTSANRIKRRLNEFGIHSSVIQTPHSITRDGCGYSLRFEDTTKNIVEKTSYELGIKIRAFYFEDVAEDGKKVYIKQ